MAVVEVFIFLLVTMILVVMVFVMISSIKIIQPYEIGLLLVTGMFRKKLDPGFNLVPPIISKVEIIDMRTTPYVIPIRNVRTRDKRDISREVIVYAKVVDPIKAHFEVTDHKKDIQMISERIIKTELRKIKYREVNFS